ncbi:hypothetical protein AX14_007850 [Amanita brunnescens Koide BX004]|nr:hypothetical protein AX14_007850 [Amanita brunnescens Koide BX004]
MSAFHSKVTRDAQEDQKIDLTIPSTRRSRNRIWNSTNQNQETRRIAVGLIVSLSKFEHGAFKYFTSKPRYVPYLTCPIVRLAAHIVILTVRRKACIAYAGVKLEPASSSRNSMPPHS